MSEGINSTNVSEFGNPCYLSEYRQLYFWINGVLLNTIGLLGIAGNIISLIILSKPRMKSSINYLLINLARCDIVLIVTSMLHFGLPLIYPYTGFLRFYCLKIFPIQSFVVYPIATIVRTTIPYLTLAVTLERYVAVFYPLKSKALCTYNRAKIYVYSIVLICILFNIPKFFEIGLKEHLDDEYGTVYCIESTEFRKDPLYVKIYINWISNIFIIYIPFISITIINTLIYLKVRKINRHRQQMNWMEIRELKLATILFAIVIVFLCCNILPLILNIVEAIDNEIDTRIVKMSNLLLTINSSVNFLVYVAYGEKFRNNVKEMFCKRKINVEAQECITLKT
ncbi:unnamed protein product [Diamesa serratosioi]